MIVDIAMEDELEGLRKRLKAVRERMGKTQAEFAEALGISQSALSEMESGRTKPSAQALLGVAIAFPEIDRDWLVRGGNGPMAYWDQKNIDPQPWAGSMRFGSDQKLSTIYPEAIRCAVHLLDEINSRGSKVVKPNRELEFLNIIYNFFLGAYQDALKIEEWREKPDDYATKICSDWASRIVSFRSGDEGAE